MTSNAFVPMPSPPGRPIAGDAVSNWRERRLAGRTFDMFVVCSAAMALGFLPRPQVRPAARADGPLRRVANGVGNDRMALDLHAGDQSAHAPRRSGVDRPRRLGDNRAAARRVEARLSGWPARRARLPWRDAGRHGVRPLPRASGRGARRPFLDERRGDGGDGVRHDLRAGGGFGVRKVQAGGVRRHRPNRQAVPAQDAGNRRLTPSRAPAPHGLANYPGRQCRRAYEPEPGTGRSRRAKRRHPSACGAPLAPR